MDISGAMPGVLATPCNTEQAAVKRQAYAAVDGAASAIIQAF